jgi:alkylated DNA repair dioxygenase AlkB
MSEPIWQHVADGGRILHDPAFLSPEEADTLFALLRERTPWRQEQGAFGHRLPRLTMYYADPGVHYRYSGVVHESLPWPNHLLALRRRIEALAGSPFNSLLLNYYRDGQDSMGMHADNEPELGVDPVVPSVSLGATRRFVLKHRASAERLDYQLTHGSLLLMGGALQHHWLHGVPKTTAPTEARINLTFRNILAS